MAGLVAGGLFNAFAFAGAGYLFKALDGGNYKAEIKRHNLALEELSRAKEAWYEQNVKKQQEIFKREKEIESANLDLNATNKALDELKKVVYKNKEFYRQPHLQDFYEPSEEMIKYKNLFLGSCGVAAGWCAYKVVRKIRS